MKKAIVVIVLFVFAALYAVSSYANNRPFRLVGKFTLVKEYFYVENDTLNRVRIFNVKVLTKSDSVMTEKGFDHYKHYTDILEVSVLTKVGLKQYGLSNMTTTSVLSSKKAKGLTSIGELGKSSYENPLPNHVVEGLVQVKFIKRDELIYLAYITPENYRKLFEKR